MNAFFYRIGFATGFWVGMHLPDFVVRWYARRYMQS